MTSDTPVKKSEIHSDLWLICPICKNPNPTGTLHCRYCWGPSLYAVDPLTNAELADYLEKQHSRNKRLRFLRYLSVYLGAPLLMLAGVLFWLYNFTDLVFAPVPHLNSASLPGEAAMYRYNLGRTGSTGYNMVDPVGELKWSFETGAAITSTPVVVGDTVYFGSNDHNLYAVNTVDGSLRWKFTTGSWVESSPAVVNGIVYFGSNDGNFYALDAVTGQKIWDFQTNYVVKSSPAVANGVVYFGSHNYNLYALNARTGSVVWIFPTGSFVYSSPVISNGILYVGSNDNSVYAINASDGRERLKLTHREVLSSPTLREGEVFFTSHRFMVVMDGLARNWPFETPIRVGWWILYRPNLVPPPPPMTGLVGATRISFYNTNTTPVYSEGKIFTTGDNRVYRIDADNLQIEWYFPTGGLIEASPCLAGDVLYAASQDGKLYALDTDTGLQTWNYDTGSSITASPTYGHGVVYVGARNGILYAIR